MKKLIKNPILMFILGAVIFGGVGTVLAYSYAANQIAYNPNDSSWKVNNIKDAIDSLYISKTADNYSTEEQVVGTWIDGKPIYQKTITGLNIQVTKGGTSWIDIATVQDIETGINAIFYWRGVNGRLIEMTPSEYGVIKDNVLSAWGFFETRTMVAVTIQYTKTTDTATK